MQDREGVTANDRDAHVVRLLSDMLALRNTSQVTDWARDDGHLVPFAAEMSCQFMMARSAGFVQRSKRLVDQEDMHIVNILLDSIYQ